MGRESGVMGRCWICTCFKWIDWATKMKILRDRSPNMQDEEGARYEEEGEGVILRPSTSDASRLQISQQ